MIRLKLLLLFVLTVIFISCKNLVNPTRTRIILEIKFDELRIQKDVVIFEPKILGLRDMYDDQGNPIREDPNIKGVDQKFIFSKNNFDKLWPTGANDEVFEVYCDPPKSKQTIKSQTSVISSVKYLPLLE